MLTKKNLEPSMGRMTIQLVFVNGDATRLSVIIIDRILQATLTFINTPDTQ